MENLHNGAFRLITSGIALSFVASSYLYAGVGKLSVVSGEVLITREQKQIKGTVNSDIEEKDTLNTGPGASTQIIFNDGTVITVGGGSDLKVEEFVSDGAEQKASLSITKGAFKAITGAIGKANPDKFKVSTSTSTIGIRGTRFLGQVAPTGEKIACTKGTISVAPVGIPGVPPVVVPAGFIVSVAPGAAPEPPRPYEPAELKQMEQSTEANKQEQQQGGGGGAAGGQGEGGGGTQQGGAQPEAAQQGEVAGGAPQQTGVEVGAGATVDIDTEAPDVAIEIPDTPTIDIGDILSALGDLGDVTDTVTDNQNANDLQASLQEQFEDLASNNFQPPTEDEIQDIIDDILDEEDDGYDRGYDQPQYVSRSLTGKAISYLGPSYARNPLVDATQASYYGYGVYGTGYHFNAVFSNTGYFSIFGINDGAQYDPDVSFYTLYNPGSALFTDSRAGVYQTYYAPLEIYYPYVYVGIEYTGTAYLTGSPYTFTGTDSPDSFDITSTIWSEPRGEFVIINTKSDDLLSGTFTSGSLTQSFSSFEYRETEFYGSYATYSELPSYGIAYYKEPSTSESYYDSGKAAVNFLNKNVLFFDIDSHDAAIGIGYVYDATGYAGVSTKIFNSNKYFSDTLEGYGGGHLYGEYYQGIGVSGGISNGSLYQYGAFAGFKTAETAPLYTTGSISFSDGQANMLYRDAAGAYGSTPLNGSTSFIVQRADGVSTIVFNDTTSSITFSGANSSQTAAYINEGEFAVIGATGSNGYLGSVSQGFVLAPFSESDAEYVTWGYWAADGDTKDAIHLSTWVAGSATPTISIPTSGSYTYTGSVIGGVIKNGNDVFAIIPNHKDATNVTTLNIDFGAGTIGGTMNFKFNEGSGKQWNMSVSSGTMAVSTANSSFSANLGNGSGGDIAGTTGDINGKFFGSEAQAVGGAFKATGDTSYDASGVFKANR